MPSFGRELASTVTLCVFALSGHCTSPVSPVRSWLMIADPRDFSIRFPRTSTSPSLGPACPAELWEPKCQAPFLASAPKGRNLDLLLFLAFSLLVDLGGCTFFLYLFADLDDFRF